MNLSKITFLATTSILASCDSGPDIQNDRIYIGSNQETGTISSARVNRGKCIVADPTHIYPKVKNLQQERSAIGGALASGTVDILFGALQTAISEAAKPKEIVVTATKSMKTNFPTGNTNGFPSCIHFTVGNYYKIGNRINSAAVNDLKAQMLAAEGLTTSLNTKIENSNLGGTLVNGGHYLSDTPNLFAEFYLRPIKVGDKNYLTASPTVIIYNSVFATRRLGSTSGSRDLVFGVEIKDFASGNTAKTVGSFTFGVNEIRSGSTNIFYPTIPFENAWVPYTFSSSDIVSEIKISATETRDASEFLKAVDKLLTDNKKSLTDPIKESVDPAAGNAAELADLKARNQAELALLNQLSKTQVAIEAYNAAQQDKTLATKALTEINALQEIQLLYARYNFSHGSNLDLDPLKEQILNVIAAP